MRPSSGGDAPPSFKPPSRKSSVADRAAAHAGAASHRPTTFFLRTEADMERSLSSSQGSDSTSKQEDSTYGVQSLADTLEAAFGQESRGHDRNPGERSGASPAKSQRSMSPSAVSQGVSPRNTGSLRSSPTRKHVRKTSNMASAPLTPLNIDAVSPLPTSAMPSTPKSVSLHSLKLSDEDSCVDDAASQAIMSSGEDEDEETQPGASTSFPQLVMPSIQMPSRRPFTTKGKAMGKLKVLVAGETGLGKSSLIRSIVQLCEDIVHVDPLSPSPSNSISSPPPTSKSRKRKAESTGTARITEIHASTKSYPPWWTDLEESRALRRRKSSLSDNVLERNLCFIDTPGYEKDSSKSTETERVVEYVESLLYRNASTASMDNSELLGVISGNGGVQVDVVLYLLRPDHDISKDLEYMQRLSSLTNVIPLIAKSDTRSPSELLSIKTSVLARLQTTSIKPFLFGKALDDALLAVQGLTVANSPTISASYHDPSTSADEPKQYPFHVPTQPYAISSTQGSDADTMDASLLMSPDYVQPLFPSELATLVAQLFEPDSIAWLRHSAAKKFLAWRQRTKLPGDSFIMHGLQRQQQRGSVSSTSGPDGIPACFEELPKTANPLAASGTSSIFSGASPSGVLIPRPTSPFYLSNSQYNSHLQSPFPASSPSLSHTRLDGLEGPGDFSLTRFDHYAKREERLAEVRLAKWASQLQRSLSNERERYEELQRNERAKWLLERVGEEVRGGSIVTSRTSSPRADWAVVRHGEGKEAGVSQRYTRAGRLSSRDPLGLCDFNDEFMRRGVVIVKVLGGMSVLGAVVIAVVKACGVETGLSSESNRLWSWLTGSE